jgi:hypothetical protein
VRYSNDEMAFSFVKTAWRLGYEAGRRAESWVYYLTPPIK